MQKQIILAFVQMALLCLTACAHSRPQPNLLIGDDFGILKNSDIAINDLEAEPAPFNEAESSSYQYWRCFRTENTRASCEGSEPGHAIFGVDITTPEAEHHYIAQSMDDAENCAWLKNEWIRVMRGQAYVCLSAKYSGRQTEASGKRGMNWIIDRFKTPVGCVSYFRGGCDIEYQRRSHSRSSSGTS